MQAAVPKPASIEFRCEMSFVDRRKVCINPLDVVASRILGFSSDRPIRVGVDGRSAAGKTTFADALSERLRGAGRIVMRAGIDDFHPPGHGLRSAAGGYTAESYYAEGYDFVAFRDLLLAPLDVGGDCRCRLGLHDSLSD